MAIFYLIFPSIFQSENPPYSIFVFDYNNRYIVNYSDLLDADNKLKELFLSVL